MTRRRSETRQRLLDAAFEVFAERGFGRATVEDVCDAAGFSRGAFYSNFGSLDELFFALYTQRAARLAEQVSAALTGPAATAALGPLEDLVQRVLDALGTERRWFCITTEFLVHCVRHPDLAEELAAHRTALRQALTPALTAATAGRELPTASADPQWLARTLVALHEGTTIATLVEPDHPGMRDWQRSVLLLAVTAPTGPG